MRWRNCGGRRMETHSGFSELLALLDANRVDYIIVGA
jgi:hypothetical protein